MKKIVSICMAFIFLLGNFQHLVVEAKEKEIINQLQSHIPDHMRRGLQTMENNEKLVTSTAYGLLNTVNLVLIPNGQKILKQAI